MPASPSTAMDQVGEDSSLDWGLVGDVFRSNMECELLLDCVPATVLLSELDDMQAGNNSAAVKKRISQAMYDFRKSSTVLNKASTPAHALSSASGPQRLRVAGSTAVRGAAPHTKERTRSDPRKRSRNADASARNAFAPSPSNAPAVMGGRPTREELLRRLRQKIEDIKTGQHVPEGHQRLVSHEEALLVERKKIGGKRRKTAASHSSKGVGVTASRTRSTAESVSGASVEHERVQDSSTSTLDNRQLVKSAAAGSGGNADDLFEYSRFGTHDVKAKARQKVIEETTAPVTNKGAKAKRIRAGIKALEKRNASMSAINESDNRDGEMKSALMDDALKKAEGLRVLDNLKKLRARQKTMFKRKAASKQKWADRLKQQEEQQQAKQQRRQDALRERRDRKRLQLAKKGKVNFFDMVTSGAESWQQQQEMEKVLDK